MTKSTTSPKMSEKKQLPRLTRADEQHRPGFRLTERDMAICDTLYAYRELTTAQIETLLFAPTTRSKCKLRLKLLYHHGYVQRTQNLLNQQLQFVYWLDRAGAQLVADHRGMPLSELEWKPSEHTLSPLFRAHLLATNDVRIAITLAAAQHGYTIEAWQDDATLKRELANEKVTIPGPSGGTEQVPIRPDGYFVLNTGTKRLKRFVEVDRQTITLDTWARRVRGYLAWFHSDAYERRYGSKAGGVLTITIGEKRAAHMQATAEHVGAKARFWFTTLDKATPAAILTQPIWAKASADGRYALIELSHTP